MDHRKKNSRGLITGGTSKGKLRGRIAQEQILTLGGEWGFRKSASNRDNLKEDRTGNLKRGTGGIQNPSSASIEGESLLSIKNGSHEGCASRETQRRRGEKKIRGTKEHGGHCIRRRYGKSSSEREMEGLRRLDERDLLSQGSIKRVSGKGANNDQPKGKGE